VCSITNRRRTTTLPDGISRPNVLRWIMPNGIVSVQRWADAGAEGAGQAATIPLRGFSCVYLTSSIPAADLASRMLEAAQIHIHRSTGLDDAKALLKATRSHVLLTDVAFEKGSWRDALRMARLLPLRTALVVVSRVADERLWIGALDSAAYDLILEPFHADELRRILEHAHFNATRSGQRNFAEAAV